MKIIKTIDEVRTEVKSAKQNGKSVGLVPTMGFLHEGHQYLMERAKEENDFVVVSIFVNPTQFGPGEDLESYPKDFDKDKNLCQGAGADIIFAPEVDTIYNQGFNTYVDVEGDITKKLCGKSRPGHFKGVTTVVSKLFNILLPHRAYFGQKDAQQVAVIEKMVRDLNFDVEIIPCPIVREADGLAMSSRNIYLGDMERKAALVLSKSLFEVKDLIEKGERNSKSIIEHILTNINSEPLVQIDYIEVVDKTTLESVVELQGDKLIALAVKIGKARLIDNIQVKV